MKGRLLAALRRKIAHVTVIDISDGAELMHAAHWIERRPLRMMVPAHLLRMQGAFRYDQDHPFLRALDHGEDALEDFYTGFIPASLGEFYRLPGPGRLGYDLPTWEIPWYNRANRVPPPGELGLGGGHGVSFHGPATAEKIDLEYQRLARSKASVLRFGYDPDGHSDIQGYVMRDGNDMCFFVRGGKHRAAVLAHLGHSKIPVGFRNRFPRLVDTGQADYWPMVAAGQIGIEVAQEVFRSYTRPEREGDHG